MEEAEEVTGDDYFSHQNADEQSDDGKVPVEKLNISLYTSMFCVNVCINRFYECLLCKS